MAYSLNFYESFIRYQIPCLGSLLISKGSIASLQGQFPNGQRGMLEVRSQTHDVSLEYLGLSLEMWLE